MARIMEMVQEVAMSEQPGAVGGVGQVKFSPNSRNVLPGTVVFTVDIRTPEQAKLDRMRATIETKAAEICAALGVGCAVEAVGHFDPVTFDPKLVASVRKAAEDLGYSHMNIISGAGHDAMKLHTILPQAMLFVRGLNSGISHNPLESTTKLNPMTTQQQLDAWIDAHFDEEVRFLQELVRVPTDTPPGNNAPHAERTAELL
eukprot:gene1937-2271_t